MRTLLLFILLFVCSLTYGQTIFIGDVEYGTVSAAINAAENGDILDISGTFTETITINKNITLRGNDPATAILQGHETKGSATQRVITINNQASNVIIENLTIRHGDANSNKGGGIYSNKADDLTLSNVIIEDNEADNDGGGIFLVGTSATLTNVTIQNNTTGGRGGGIGIAPNNDMSKNTEVVLSKVLLTGNTATNNGGGFYVTGNKDYGDQFKVDLSIENTTIFANNANLGSIGYVKSSKIVANSVGNIVDENNITLTLNHLTAIKNIGEDINNKSKTGLYFLKDAEVTNGANLSIYNSVILMDEDLDYKAVNFSNTYNATLYNNFIGGVTNLVSVGTNVDNRTGKLVSQSGLSTELTDEGGKVKVLTHSWNSNLMDQGTSTYSTINGEDVIGTYRSDMPDIGAYEYPETVLDGTRYKTISAAITAASDGDIIKVTGIHTEVISINKNISLVGIDATKDIIQADKLPNTASSRVIGISGVSNVKLSDLTIRYGNTTGQGGGIHIEQSLGSVQLERMVIEDNYSTARGGGIAMRGADVSLTGVTIQNNTSEKEGGGAFITPLNFDGGDNVTVQFNRCLLNANTSILQGGGFYIDGLNGFGDNYSVDVILKNSVIFDNKALTGSVGYVKGDDLVANAGRVVGDNNVSLTMDHMTIAYNTISSLSPTQLELNNSGLHFKNNAGDGKEIPFTMTNSILINGDDVAYKSVNFRDTEATNVINNIVGGTVNKAADFNDVNVAVGRTATNVMIANELTDVGGEILILELDPLSPAVDAGGDPGSNDSDILGHTRDSAPDLGVYQVSQVNEPVDLPVELVYFSGYLNGNDVVLNWKTATEINNAYFEVERSVDGLKSIETIAKIEGYGNSLTAIEYSYTDLSVQGGRVLYRLKQVDFDGSTSYFDWIEINNNNINSSIAVYPNPQLQGQPLKVRILDVSDDNLEIELIDMSGNITFKNEFESNTSLSINTDKLKSGLYIMKVKQGTTINLKKILIK